MTSEPALLHQVSVDVATILERTKSIDAHLAILNGRVGRHDNAIAENADARVRMQSAIMFGRWLFAAMLGLMGLGVALASLVLGLLLKHWGI